MRKLLQLYNNFLYLKSIFYKGPFLVATSNLEENLSPASYITINAYKNNIKHVVLTIQGSGLADEWEPNNFPLHDIRGPRKSCTERVAVVTQQLFRQEID